MILLTIPLTINNAPLSLPLPKMQGTQNTGKASRFIFAAPVRYLQVVAANLWLMHIAARKNTSASYATVAGCIIRTVKAVAFGALII